MKMPGTAQHEARLYVKGEGQETTCSLCSHRCHIREGKTGICGVRKNVGGTLYATTYSLVSAEAVDPVEKKPLYHYLPGTTTYSLGSIGCNFSCAHCQNWHISRNGNRVRLQEIPPVEGVRRAVAAGCSSIAWTYNEPTIWHEYALEMASEARKQGLGTIYVTNGYITEEGLDELSPVLNAFRVDIKAFHEEFYRSVCHAHLEPVLASTVRAHELGMHVEIVNLVIPGLNDREEEVTGLIRWIIDTLGPEVPVHFTRFHPDYHMTDRMATPLATLEKIYRLARDNGLFYPYLGNVASHPFEHTYCPTCHAPLIIRSGFDSRIIGLDGTRCRSCGTEVGIVRTP
jgi:pyruvate formate lyase activating enzyme